MSFSRKYIGQVFSLKKLLVSEHVFKLVCFNGSLANQG